MGGALSRGVLVQLVEHHEQQRPGGPPSPCLELLEDGTPTTNRFARSWRLWRSTTVTWAPARCGAVAGAMSARRSRRSAGADGARSRRTNALTVPARVAGPGPVDAGFLVLDLPSSTRSTRSSKVRTTVAVDADTRRRPRLRLRRASLTF